MIGKTKKDNPLQIAAGVLLTICGEGFTTIVTVKFVEAQPFVELEVAVYTTVCGTMVVLIKVWLTLNWGVVWSTSPVTFGLSTTVQVYLVPANTISPPPLVGVTLNALLLQIVRLLGPITAVGTTVTSISKVVGSHPFAVVEVTV